MKANVIAACLHLFRTKRMLRSLNIATITLIPKIVSPERLEDYRPISCLGVAYRCFSKIIASRLMRILPEIINPNQTAFIRGRRITDAIRLAQEFTQGFNCQSTSRRACITIDFSKAFDMLRWDAIKITMELLGIDETFRRLVMSCVMTASMSALIEGSPTEIIKPGRGLRQGDPLSPLLFAIVIDYLSKLMDEAVHSRKIELYTSGGAVVESHLAFADDVIFFCRASHKSI